MYFLEVCNCKSISKASKNLYLSQQALSSAIKKIETDIGVKLFVRNQSGIILTPYGESFKKHACEIVLQMDLMARDFEQIQKKEQQILNVAMSFGVISALPDGYIKNFELLHPDIHLKISEYPDLHCEEAVQNEQEDIGFSIAPIDETSFDFRTILSNKMCILVSNDNPLSINEEIDFDQLKNEKFLLLKNDFKIRHNFIKKCRKSGFEPEISLETMELILIHNYSRLNKGIGVGVSFIGMDIADVKVIPLRDPDCTWDVCVITKKNCKLTPAAECFLNYINNQKFHII